jgi:hypothetical protein
MHARALPAHAAEPERLCELCHAFAAIRYVSAVSDALRSVGMDRHTSEIESAYQTLSRIISMTRRSRAPALSCKPTDPQQYVSSSGRVPFQSPEIVETSSPCSPQKETNKRCWRERDRPASNGRSGQSNPTEQRKKARSPAGAASQPQMNQALWDARACACLVENVYVTRVGCRKHPLGGLQHNKQTNNTTMHKRERTPIDRRPSAPTRASATTATRPATT